MMENLSFDDISGANVRNHPRRRVTFLTSVSKMLEVGPLKLMISSDRSVIGLFRHGMLLNVE